MLVGKFLVETGFHVCTDISKQVHFFVKMWEVIVATLRFFRSLNSASVCIIIIPMFDGSGRMCFVVLVMFFYVMSMR